MNIKRFPTIISLLFVLLLGVAISANAFSIKELLGFGDDESDAAAQKDAGKAKKDKAKADAKNANWGKQTGTDSTPLSVDTVKMLLANLNQNQRALLLGDQERFKQFVEQELRNKSVFAAAIANNLHKDPNTVFLMQRGAETVMRETYLNRLLNSKIPADFPSDEQVKEYYEKNKQQFVIGERVHVWQVFFSSKDKDEKAVKEIQSKADDIAKRLASGKVAFEKAVEVHSEHEQSRNNAGYMGLLKVSDLKPDVRDVIVDLKPGKVSKAVKSDTGIHIFKRGDKVAQQDVELEQVNAQIRNLLLKQARTQLLNAIFQQAEESYPRGMSDEQIEKWRVELSQGS